MELPQRETGMADTPVKQVARKLLSMEIDHRQDLSLDVVDIGWKLVEPDVVAMHPMTAKDDYPKDVEHHEKAVTKSDISARCWLKFKQKHRFLFKRRAKQ